MMERVLGALRLPIFLLGVIGFFAAERYFAAASFFPFLKYGSLVLAVLGAVIPYVMGQVALRAERPNEAVSLWLVGLWQVVLTSALLCYLLYRGILGDATAPQTFAPKALLALWVFFLVVGIVCGIGMENAFRLYGRGRGAEPVRIEKAGLGWLKVGLVLSAFLALNFAAVKKDRTFDWSYFKATKPGTSSLKMVKNVQDPVEVAIFYPYKNDVKPFVAEYFETLARESGGKITVQHFDKDLHPTKAEELKVTGNGQVVLHQDDRREKIDVGLKLTQARANLAKLDSIFQKAFLALTSKAKTFYFTRGHGEMEWQNGDPFRVIRGFELLMRSQNYVLKTFGSREGSLQQVPDDAAAVVIAGPSQAFLQEEVDVLKKYVDEGGKLLVFLDEAVDAHPSMAAGKDPLKGYLQSVGLTYSPTRIANDKSFVRAARTDVDHWFIFSNVFGSHESVESLSRNDDRMGVLVYQGGSFQAAPVEGDWRTFEVIKSLNSSFDDKNRNYAFDEGKEKRQSWVLAAAAEKAVAGKEAQDPKAKAKIYAFADASVISDFLIRNPANQLLVLDAARWVAGDSAISGEIASEEDVRIRHSKVRELFVFHGSIFLVPILVLATGFVATRKRRKGGKNA